MKKIFIVIFSFVLGFAQANLPLEDFIESDKDTCIEVLRNTSTKDLWDLFLREQASLFSKAEHQWMTNGKWWQTAHNILEIGCGKGFYLAKLAQNYPQKAFRGVDKASQDIKAASLNYGSANLIFEEGDAEILSDYLINSADIVLFRFTLQHLKDPLKALINAHQYLGVNGYVLILDSFDAARKTSHPIKAIDEALELVRELQNTQDGGNRQITLKLLQSLKSKTSELNNYFEIAHSNYNLKGNLIKQKIILRGKKNRKLCVNQLLLFLVLLERTYHIPINLSEAYDQLKDYSTDKNAWILPGLHFLVLKKIV